MIKKISNWIFGSFFRTIGRLLVYILLGYLLSILLSKYDISGLFNILEVHAYDASTWLTDTLPIEEADFYNWSSGSSYSHLATGTSSEYFYTNDSINEGNDLLNYRNIYITSNVNMGSNGVSFVLKMPLQLTSNVLYNVNMYVCGSTGTAPSPYSVSIRAGSSYTNSLTANYNYSNVQRISIGTAGFKNSNASSTYNKCYLYSGLIDTKQSGAFVSFRLTNSVSGQYAVIGMTYNTIGLTNGLKASEVQSIINNSGLASASSISAVQSSVNQVKTEIQATQDAINNQTQQQQQNHQETMDTLKDDNTNESQSTATSFFNNFNTNNHGLTGIITAPLNAIQSLSSKTCSPLVLPLPYVNKELTLPCMRDIYVSNFGSFMSLYDTITTGIVAYWICVRIFGLVKDFKNPEHDEIEVVDL